MIGHAIEPLNDGEIERMRDSTRQDLSDPKVAQSWAQQAKQDLERLLEILGSERQGAGSAFAETLRDAIEERIIRKVNGRAELTKSTELASLNVSVTPHAVIADVRLNIGRWQQ